MFFYTFHRENGNIHITFDSFTAEIMVFYSKTSGGNPIKEALHPQNNSLKKCCKPLEKRCEVCYTALCIIRRCDGIGRRAGLKIQW